MRTERPAGPGPRVGIPHASSERPPAPSRILVSRIRRIGDVILSLPVLDALRDAYPSAVIDYLAEEGPAQAAVGHPALRAVLTYRPEAWWGLPADPDLLLRLRAARYDWAIDLYGNPRSALLTWITGARTRVGPPRRARRLLFTHAIPGSPEPLSAVEHHLQALGALGLAPRARKPRIHLTEGERAEGRALLEAAAPAGLPRVGLHVGNRWPAKRWPEERFQALLRAFSKIGIRGVVLAGPEEEEQARRVASRSGGPWRSGVPVIAGIPLRGYFGVVASLDALVTNDGSPLHAGPALGVPTVGILGPTEPRIWFPYDAAEGHQLLCKEIWCRPCHRHECARLDCLEWIGVGDVLRATERALGRAERTVAGA